MNLNYRKFVKTVISRIEISNINKELQLKINSYKKAKLL